MDNAQRLLAEPPAALMAARQGASLPCQIDNIEMPEYLLDFVAEADHPLLLRYLDALLADGVASGDLRGLFERAGAGDRFAEMKDARGLFEGLQRVLRRQVKSNG